ncbi:MAG: protocatechuate 3,4-dioxygenase subunit alpha [Pseudomonadota bacterium]
MRNKELQESASQTAGPYVHIGLAPRAAGFDIYEREVGWDIAGPNAEGERIKVEGVVWDGNGEPVKDVLLEIWQANSAGHFANNGGQVEPGFRGWGRVISDFDTGVWAFDTVKPGAVGAEAPHLHIWIVARGINIGLHTRMYFPDEDNGADPVLTMIGDDTLAATLIAKPQGAGQYRFDIHLQGEDETVFFDV